MEQSELFEKIMLLLAEIKQLVNKLQWRRAVVARQAHNLQVGGSSPPAATKNKKRFGKLKNFSYLYKVKVEANTQ